MLDGTKPLLVLKHQASVSDRGELVVLRFGNVEFSMEFQVALEVSALMRREARAAKLSAGNDSFRRNMVGILTDATAPVKALSRWRKALPERLKRRDIHVASKGQVVDLTFGTTTATLPYPEAHKIAQWLRVHGKLARNAAGEKANWAQLAGVAS